MSARGFGDRDMYTAMVQHDGKADMKVSDYTTDGSKLSRRRKKNDDAASKKLDRVRAAAKLREDNGYDELWNDMLKMYTSRYDYPELGSYKDVVAPNMAFSTVNVIVPSVALNNPKFMVSARSPEAEAAADIAEVVVNYQWDALEVGDEFRIAAKDFSIFGHGWIKTSWLYETETRDTTPEEFQEQLDTLLMQREEALASGVPEEQLPTPQEIVDSIDSTTEEVVKDEPLALRVSPFDIFLDPDSNTLRDARWIAHRMVVPLSKARKDERWDRKQRAKLAPVRMSEARRTVDQSSDIETTSESSYGEIYEWYDLLNNTVCVIGVGCDDYLLAPTEIPFKFGHPFIFIPNYEVPERFYPIGDVESIFSLQVELATTRTQMINDRKRFRRVYLYKPEMLEPDSLDKFKSGEDDVMIEVLRDIPFNEIMAPLASATLPPEFYNQTEMISGDINVVSGVNEYQRGNAAPIRRTATEAAMLADAANARVAEKLGRIETAAAHVAANLIALNQQFLEGEAMARLVGDDGTVTWQEYSAESLDGSFEFKVEVGSTQPTDDSMRQQKALQLLDVMSPFIGEVIDPWVMAEHVLRQFGVRDTERFMVQQQPPPAEGQVPIGPDGQPLPPEMPPGPASGMSM